MILRDVYQKWYWKPSTEGCMTCRNRSHDSSITCPERIASAMSPLYGGALYFTRCEGAPSLAVRDEHLLRGADRLRFARRIHLFERADSHDGDTAAEPDQEPVGEYLGCVNMRPPKGLAGGDQLVGIAEGLVRLPRRMRSRDYQFPLLSSIYTPFFGLLPFECIPYASQTASIGGYCAQTCVYMCLLMTVPEGGVARGPFTLTCQAKYSMELQGGSDEKLPPDAPECIDGTQHEGTAFKITGLSEKEMVDLLNTSEDHEVQRIMPVTPKPLFAYADRLKRGQNTRLSLSLYSYVQSGVPVIVLLNSNVLWHSVIRNEDEWLHAVVVVGTKGTPWDGREFSIVYMDPSKGPYRERGIGDFAAAATALEAYDNRGGESAACLIPVFPKAVGLRFDHLRKVIPRRQNEEVIPILLKSRYWSARLVRNQAIDDCLPGDLSAEQAADFKDRVREHVSLPPYVWALEQYNSITSARRHEPERCAFFEASVESTTSTPHWVSKSLVGGFVRSGEEESGDEKLVIYEKIGGRCVCKDEKPLHNPWMDAR